jgi:septal ring factor EnvC (AmiA/AmiB activator)
MVSAIRARYALHLHEKPCPWQQVTFCLIIRKVHALKRWKRLMRKTWLKPRHLCICSILLGVCFVLTLLFTTVSYARDQGAESIDDVAKLVNESERRKLEVARALRDNKKAYDELERELAKEKQASVDNLVRLHRVIAFRRLLSEQNITGNKVWWNAELALRSAIEESLRRQLACKMQMAELERLEKVLERNLRELADAEVTFRKNLQQLVSVSRKILRRQAMERDCQDSSTDYEAFASFFKKRSGDESTKSPCKDTVCRDTTVPSGGWQSNKLGRVSNPPLLLPVEGIVETGVELKKSVDSIPLVYSKGVFIKARDGVPVRAVADGQVVYSGWFREFGRTVIIDHGDHYFSVTTYLGSVKVSEGDSVKQGDIIGEVARSEILGESGIYFEWRHNGKPLDVKRWFALKTSYGKGD